jgi:type 1 glutamine amidotransferase
MEVLLICGDTWHPTQVPVDGVATLSRTGFQFDIITDAKDFKTDTLSAYPAVLLCKCDQINEQDKESWKTEELQQAFVDYVEAGGGLLAVHTAVVAGENTGTLDNLLGCKFSYHPHELPVTVQPLKPHPVTEGVEVFCEVDEHYRLEILAPDADIITASYSPAQGDESKYKEDPYNNSPAWICPSGIVRTQGKGRVCVLTPGHLLPVWLNPQYQKTLANALRWCAGS